MNDLVTKHHVSYSQILQKAFKKHLGVHEK